MTSSSLDRVDGLIIMAAFGCLVIVALVLAELLAELLSNWREYRDRANAWLRWLYQEDEPDEPFVPCVPRWVYSSGGIAPPARPFTIEPGRIMELPRSATVRLLHPRPYDWSIDGEAEAG